MKTFYFIDEKGNKVPLEVEANKKIKKDNKKDSKLKRKIATKVLVIAVGVGIITGGLTHCVVQKEKQKSTSKKPTTSASDSMLNEVKDGLRFEPNSKESVVNNAVLLIEEAAKCGKELDAEDAVLATIVANSNELTAGFMGELFGERAEQTYTYNTLVDAYLRVGMMQVENVGVATNDEVAFNIENIFANEEDYNYLSNIRELTSRFNNSNDEKEKAEITDQLNKIAFDLCTYDAYDISSPAGILSMLTLDGMRIVTNNSTNPILHDDIRDEMFGNGDYACQKEETFTENGQVFQTAYSYRVNDVKLDSVKTKLDNAVLEEGKTTILADIIAEVEEKTKDVQVSDFDMVEEINKEREENRTVTYEYESAPGVVKDNYSEKTDKDVVQNVGGKDVIIVDNNKTNTQTETNINQTNPDANTTVGPEITTEENVTVQPGESVVDTGNVEQNKQEAEEQLTTSWEKAQADSNQGSIDGEYYGQNGLAKPSFAGKSEYYINAFNANYDFWYSMNQQDLTATEPTTTAESYDLDNLSKEQLEELRSAAISNEEYTQSEEKTK